MAESRSPRQPNKPDKNEVWSWVVIAILSVSYTHLTLPTKRIV